MPQRSVTRWIDQLKAGDHVAAQRLWERYFHRLVALARTQLRHRPRRVSDEEDVVLSAFASFCAAAKEGRFPQLNDRENLWRLLVALTVRKAMRVVRDAHRRKRGGGKVLDEAALAAIGAHGESEVWLDQIMCHDPTPAFAAQVADQFEHLLDRLDDEELQTIALLKMEGYTNAEVATRIDRAVPTIERRLRIIRHILQEEVAS